MLRDEHRMTTKGRLLAVVGRLRWREAPGDQVLGLQENGVEPMGPEVRDLARPEMEPTPERRGAQSGEDIVE